MEIRQLRYFVAVAEMLSFSRAAERLYVTQPTLSNQINELENELNVSLFVRSTRSVRLTAAGKELYTNAKLLLNHMENIIRSVRSSNDTTAFSSTLSIGIEDSVFSMQNTPVPDIISRFASAHTNIYLDVRPIQPINDQARILSGEIDLAFIYLLDDESPDLGLKEKCVFRDKIALAAPKGWNNPHDSSALAAKIDASSVFFSADSQRWTTPVLSILSHLNVFPRQYSINNMITASTYVKMGRGIYFAPTNQIKAIGGNYTDIIEYPEDNTEIRLSAIYCSHDNNPVVEKFLNSLPELIAN